MRSNLILKAALTVLLFTILLTLSSVRHAQALPGDLDTSFGGDGRVTTDFSGTGDFEDVSDIAIGTDGRIVAVGGIGDFEIARYNSDGSLDNTFSGDGKQTTDFGQLDLAQAVAIQPDGRVVVAGTGGGSNFALARYNPDGSPDSTFSGDGRLTTDFPGGVDSASDVVIQADGRIVVAGSHKVNTSPTDSAFDFALARYNPDGSLDNTFSGDGRLTTNFGASDTAFADAVAIQSDGRIVVAGTSGGNFALARYNSNGSLDSTFSGDGRLTTDFGESDRADSVAIQSDGRLVAAGDSSIDSDPLGFALARYNSDGSLDSAFSGDGTLITEIGTFGSATAVAIQTDGKIVAAGGDIFTFIMVRYNPDGSLDGAFSGDGSLATDFSTESSFAKAVAIQSNNGRIVAAGNADGDFALARYHAFDCLGANVTRVGSSRADFIVGTANNDVISGLNGSDRINGAAGNDIICGGDGGDTIFGGDNNDVLFGQLGNDALDGGNGADRCNVGTDLIGPSGTAVNCEGTFTGNSGLSGEWLTDVVQTCDGTTCTVDGIIQISNPGTEPAGASTLRFFLSSDETLEEVEDELIRETQVGSLNPEEAVEVNLDASLSEEEEQDAEEQFVIAFLDANDDIAEVREDNNIVVSSVVVGEGGSGGCAVAAGSVDAGSSLANVFVFLVLAFAVGFRIMRRSPNHDL